MCACLCMYICTYICMCGALPTEDQVTVMGMDRLCILKMSQLYRRQSKFQLQSNPINDRCYNKLQVEGVQIVSQTRFGQEPMSVARVNHTLQEHKQDVGMHVKSSVYT